MNVSRGNFYNHIFRSKKENSYYAMHREELKVAIQKIFEGSHQIYGTCKITEILKQQGYHTSEATVANIMRELGLCNMRQKAKSLYRKELRNYRANLLRRNFNPSRPNEIWVSDVTYFRYKEKNYYICVVMDLFSRKVIGYKISYKNSTQLVKQTLKMAYINRVPLNTLLLHTDRGSAYCSRTFCDYVSLLGIEQSFSHTSSPYDNAVVEYFFANMKREELYRIKYRSEREIRKSVDDYIRFYNEQRPHSKNNYKTLVAREQAFFNSMSQ